MKVTLSNSVTIEGSETEVRSIATKVGYGYENDGIHYMSSSRGLVVITDMTTSHLINALRKLYRAWADKLPTNSNDLMRSLVEGPNDVTCNALVRELAQRSKRVK